MNKLLLKIHRWLALPFGIIIITICSTGAILVFEPEFTELRNKIYYTVNSTNKDKIPVSVLIKKITDTLPDSLSVSGVQIPAELYRAYQISLSGKNSPGLYVDPYSGKLIEKQYNRRIPFFNYTRQLHRWLLFQGDTRKVGKYIVGYSTLAMVLVLISSLFIWIPKRLKHIKKRLRIRFKSGWRKFFRDIHVAGGVYVVFALLVLSLTGLTWSFDWYRNSFYKFFGGENKNSVSANKTENRDSINYMAWDNVLAQVYEKEGCNKEVLISHKVATVQTDVKFNALAKNKYIFEPSTGNIINMESYISQPSYNKLRGTIYTLHTGAWGGIVVKFIYFFVSFMGVVLAITGFYMYFKRRHKYKRKHKHKSH